MTFCGLINDKIVCFCGLIPLPLHKGVKRFHRVVVHPDYQGIGVGTAFIEEICKKFTLKGWDIVLTTTTPALIYKLDSLPNWSLYHQGRVTSTFEGLDDGDALQRTISNNRVTFSFKYVPPFKIKREVEY